MRTVVLGKPSTELEQMIARRRALGLDGHDEVWEGDYHMVPMANGKHGWIDQQIAEFLGPLLRDAGLFGTGAVNLGDPDNFRVPDRAVHRVPPTETWFATAAIVVEIESPDDETWEKLAFYAGHRVEEIVVVSPERRDVTWLALEGSAYVAVERSRVISSGSRELVTSIEWPPAE